MVGSTEPPGTRELPHRTCEREREQCFGAREMCRRLRESGAGVCKPDMQGCPERYILGSVDHIKHGETKTGDNKGDVCKDRNKTRVLNLVYVRSHHAPSCTRPIL